MAKIPPRRSIQGVVPRVAQPRGRLRERVEVTGLAEKSVGEASADTPVDNIHSDMKVVNYAVFRVSTKDRN